MRTLVLTKNFPPRTCGVGDYACRLAEFLTATGNEVVVITEPATGRKEFPFALREISLAGWRDLRPLLAAIEQAAPDCVQLEYAGYAWDRWGAPWWLNALLFALWRRKISLRIGLHETAIRMRQHPLQIPVALAQWLHIGLLLAAVPQSGMAVNMPSRVTLLGRVFPWWRGRLRYRPNSSNIPVVPLAASERSGLRRERGVGSGEAVVATFGMFHQAKNYEAVIEAVGSIRKTIPVKLWMLGDASMAAPEYRAHLEVLSLEEGLAGNVWWSGRLEPEELSRTLQAADVFVLPQADGHLTRSGAFMAAAAHGLPVVAVRDPTGHDQREFTHGENIWLVERSAPEPIAEGLRKLVEDPTVAGLIGRNLQRLYEAKFDWPHTVETMGSANRPGAVEQRPYQGRERAAAAPAGGAKS
jgi:glycosyltransferase involved in cell wall biosynthesis